MKNLLALTLFAAAAHAGQVCHSVTQPSNFTNWMQSFALPKHDPLLGPLESVTVTIHGTLKGSVLCESPSPVPAIYRTRLAFQGTVRRPDASVLHAIEPNVESVIHFTSFDGQIDFAGPSGITLPDLTAETRSHATLVGAADRALFTASTPGEVISLGLYAIGVSTATGPGALVTQLNTRAEMEVTICYGYREIRQSMSIPPAFTNWQNAQVFAKHDPAVGPLRAVRMRARTTLSGSLRHENQSPVPSTTEARFSVETEIQRPDATLALLVDTEAHFVDRVDAFDGVVDFAGTSGASHLGLQVVTSDESVLTSPADLALFTAVFPGDSVALTARAMGSSTLIGSGLEVVAFQTMAGVEIELGYDYSAPVVAYCFGDGSGAACPCGNTSPVGAQQGCLHSFGTGGALSASGFAEIGADTLVLTASSMPPTTTALFFQGTSALSSPFGDGLRCAGGVVRRLGTRAASAGSASIGSPGNSISSLGSAATGATLGYQAWFRNATAFCTPSAFNLTNGLSIAW